MNSVDEAVSATVKIRDQIGMSYEEMFWFQVDTGCKFLELHFGWMAMEIATQSNFWDLWVMEWVYDDAQIEKQFYLTSESQYKRLKVSRIDDKQMCEMLYDNLERKKRNESSN